MDKITSIFDFYQKLKKDKRYGYVLIAGHIRNTGDRLNPNKTIALEEAKRWLEKWISTAVGKDKDTRFDTCISMVEYLNDKIDDVIFTHTNPEPPENLC